MSSLNNVTLIGHLGKDPEIRTMQNGERVAQFPAATSERWKDKQTGEQKERTEWHRIVIFDQNLVKLAEKHLNKGSKAYIEGQLATRKWTDNNGIERYTTEIILRAYHGKIVLLDSKNDEGQNHTQTSNYLDDEIPF